jgi:hypothetical protein
MQRLLMQLFVECNTEENGANQLCLAASWLQNEDGGDMFLRNVDSLLPD